MGKYSFDELFENLNKFDITLVDGDGNVIMHLDTPSCEGIGIPKDCCSDEFCEYVEESSPCKSLSEE